MTEHADMEIDFLDIHRVVDEEPGGTHRTKQNGHREGGITYTFLKIILTGSMVLLVLTGLSLFLIDNLQEHIISKADITIIKYQLSQIDEKMQEIERETGTSRILLTEQLDQLTKKTDALDGKMDSLNTAGSGMNSLDQFNRLAARIDQLDLKIETLGARAAALAQDRYHSVTRGESLTKIARRYGLELEALCRLNRIAVDHNIHPGDRLLIR